MTANDSGHINNLDKNQREKLKQFWIELLNRICLKENLSSYDDLVNSNYGNELFNILANDNPDVILLKWIRARKWNLNQSLDLFMETLKWRIHSNVQLVAQNGEYDLSQQEIQTGKTFFLGYDKEGHPVNYVSVKDHIKGQFTTEQTQKLTILAMETGRKLLKDPIESVTVLFDMTGFSMKNMDYEHVKYLINLLENYYPECLAHALIVNAPWLFNGCWFIIKPWLDPVVQAKIHFIKNQEHLEQFIDTKNLPKRLEGNLDNFNYIPPTDQESFMFQTFKNDYQGKKCAIENHKKAAIDFIRITIQWAKNTQLNQILEERKKAIQQLKDAFNQLIPYVSTKTHYHRIGYIHEPIFDITFANIQQRQSNQIHYF